MPTTGGIGSGREGVRGNLDCASGTGGGRNRGVVDGGVEMEMGGIRGSEEVSGRRNGAVSRVWDAERDVSRGAGGFPRLGFALCMAGWLAKKWQKCWCLEMGF